MSAIVVITSIDREDLARQLSTAILESRLAACVQVSGPIESLYRWKGEIETAQEWLLQIKSTRESFSQLESKIRETHPYETPEIIALDIALGSKSYLEWVSEQTRPSA